MFVLLVVWGPIANYASHAVEEGISVRPEGLSLTWGALREV